ncbi:TolB family protein [Draconibacterium sp.]|uniref:TolB family protein n=1 Tax=Draconibacterium sp. TaxID=1965318 RepID=UPI003565A166
MSKIFFLAINSLILITTACNSKNQRASKEKSINDYAIIYNVLVSDSTDNYDVFKMNLDGSEKKNITNLPGVEWSYISIGKKVLFLSDKDTCRRCFLLYQTNYVGENPKKVSDILLADSWMSSRKNGLEVIVTPKADSAFYIIDLEGNIQSRVETGLPYSRDPVFVNDGHQIVLRGGLTKSKLIPGFNEELYIIDIDGTNRNQLTQYPKKDTTAGRFGYKAGTPKLHPTENYITYQSKQNGKYSLFAVSIDGKKHWKLTENVQNEGWHDWSSDGKWLAIELFDDSQTQFHIGLMNWDTKELSILTDTTYKYQQSPNFVLKN